VAYNTRNLLRTGSDPVPQYFNETSDQYEVVKGADGATFVRTAGSPLLQGKVKAVTTAGTRVQLDAVPCQAVTVFARKSNTGTIFVGGSDVSASVFGVELSTNEAFTFNVANANQIYIDAEISGDGVSYVVI
jgi:hypothetical protein